MGVFLSGLKLPSTALSEQKGRFAKRIKGDARDSKISLTA